MIGFGSGYLSIFVLWNTDRDTRSLGLRNLYVGARASGKVNCRYATISQHATPCVWSWRLERCDRGTASYRLDFLNTTSRGRSV